MIAWSWDGPPVCSIHRCHPQDCFREHNPKAYRDPPTSALLKADALAAAVRYWANQALLDWEEGVRINQGIVDACTKQAAKFTALVEAGNKRALELKTQLDA